MPNTQSSIYEPIGALEGAVPQRIPPSLCPLGLAVFEGQYGTSLSRGFLCVRESIFPCRSLSKVVTVALEG